MLVDKSDLGFGKRSWRYSMLVQGRRDREDVHRAARSKATRSRSPTPTRCSSTSIPKAKAPEPVVIFAQARLPALRAREGAARASTAIEYDEITLRQGRHLQRRCAASPARGTWPQVFIGGKLIGGADDLEKYFERGAKARLMNDTRTSMSRSSAPAPPASPPTAPRRPRARAPCSSKAAPYGTTCARVGCMPSKLLIAAAEAAHARRARAGLRRARRRQRARRRPRSDGARAAASATASSASCCATSSAFRRPTASAATRASWTTTRSSSTTSTRITREEHRHRHRLARRRIPPSFEKLGDRLIVNDDVFDWDDLPSRSRCSAPASSASSSGQALHRLGVRVAVLGRGGRVGPITDPEVRAYAIATFSAEFALEPDAHVVGVERDGDRVAIRRKTADGVERTERFDYVLAATGRTPNVDGLGLENTGARAAMRAACRCSTATTMQTRAGGTSAIFIAGDASDYHSAAARGGRRRPHRGRERRALSPQASRSPRPAPRAARRRLHRSADRDRGRRHRTRSSQGASPSGEVSFEDQGRSRMLSGTRVCCTSTATSRPAASSAPR